MNLTQFIMAVDNLVLTWHDDEPDYRVVPREALQQIYNKVREQAVYECADWQAQRDKAMEALHRHYVKGQK